MEFGGPRAKEDGQTFMNEEKFVNHLFSQLGFFVLKYSIYILFSKIFFFQGGGGDN